MTKSSWHKFANQTPDGWHMIMLVTIFVMVLNNLCQLLQHVSMKGRNQMLLEYLWRLQTQVSCYHLNVSDIFARVQSLNLALQKSGESLVLANIAVYLDKTMSFFGKVKVCKQKTFLRKTKFQQLVQFFQRSNGITSTKFLHSVKPAIIWIETIWSKCLYAIPWCIYERSWGSVFIACFLDGIEHIRSKSTARKAWFA